MYSSWKNPIIFLSLFPFLSTIFPLALAFHPCTDKFHELAKARSLSHCQKLSTLGAELGWSDPSSSGNRHLLRILVGAVLAEDMGWLAWGVNPGPQPEMVGTRAAIGIKDPSSKTSLVCKTYNVTYETRIGCRLQPSVLEEVQCTSFEYNDLTGYHMVSASLNLSSADYNISRLNMVWQIGYKVEGDEPKQHVATLRNVDSVEMLNLVSGKSSDIAHIKIRLRKTMAIWFRPKPEDDFRKVWNIYHHFLGYALLAVIFANIFEGIRILKAEDIWRRAVIGILVALATITLVLEAYTWKKFFDSQKNNEMKKSEPPLPNSSKKPEEEHHQPEFQPTLVTTRPTQRPIADLQRDHQGHVPLYMD
ncbi:cytochrome b561 and DOMON domain-containing protein At2g04850-like isoform X2 [Momordica charantia]|uniref:Cytochrome b561 and DOMON domain-containing protein At2g04850-like isoform X2 n=1 Tax=Momordica charantia TaxID=3673 RepID=A0A6J1DBT9_MOMCH|nr:cytochrome b561 and DOMON domain-containing protein At2g04850-like isoform X2 [Momordica charantia]